MERLLNYELESMREEAGVAYSRYYYSIDLEGLSTAKNTQSQDSQFPGRDSNGIRKIGSIHFNKSIVTFCLKLHLN